MSAKTQFPEAYTHCKNFMLSEDLLKEVVARLSKEIKLGLAKESHARATVKCWITYVQDIPTGKERGKYLALDLGGTNFLVLLVELHGNGVIEMQSQSFIMDPNLMSGPATKLFDFIAECIDIFVNARKFQNEDLLLGFTFAFPVQQTGLAKGILIAWTKGFSCTGAIGNNVVAMMQEAINRRRKLRVTVVAILNDATATLMSCAFLKRNCRIGLVVGTGCNACYIEKTSVCEMFEDLKTIVKPNMIINTEWGAFGETGELDFMRTPFDRIMDKETLNAGKQIFEKCISSLYLGELVRLIIVDLMKLGAIFRDQDSQTIHEPWIFETNFILDVESDPPGSYRNCNVVLSQIGIIAATDDDKNCMRFICETISRRSAMLVACGLVSLINQMGVTELSVGVDGGLYRFHPSYKTLVIEYMRKLLGSTVKFELILSDGVWRGAGVVAAVASKSIKIKVVNENI